MTDNEIIKALECCQTNDERNCIDCPYCEDCTEDNNVVADTLGLINRQRTEIQELKVFAEEINDKLNCVIDCNKQNKSEIIREFAQRLKDVFISIDGTFECWEIEDYIDNLVKEMEKY